MRDMNDQLKEILKRSDNIKEKKTMMKTSVTYGIATVSLIALIIMAAIKIPNINSSNIQNIEGHYGSLMLNTYYMSYVVIGLLSFLLGITTVLLCMQINKMRKKEHH